MNDTLWARAKVSWDHTELQHQLTTTVHTTDCSDGNFDGCAYVELTTEKDQLESLNLSELSIDGQMLLVSSHNINSFEFDYMGTESHLQMIATSRVSLIDNYNNKF